MSSAVARMICGLGCALFVAHAAHALDPQQRITQYLHASWRMQDASAPAAVDSIAQTSDGFVWVSTLSSVVYRFDGLRFVARSPRKAATNKVFKIVADRAGGLWAVSRGQIAHLTDGIADFEIPLEGFSSYQNVAEDRDGSLWVVLAANTVREKALCHITGRNVKCLGTADGVPIAPIDSILADGAGGFWLGGQTSLVHWRDGKSETYPIAALKSNAGQHGVVSLALAPDGTMWVGMLAEGPGLGLGRLRRGVVEPFTTPTFDGSKAEVFGMMFDRDANLWVGTRGKGLYRIHGDSVDHFGRSDGLSSDDVNLLFEDREGIVWAGTTNGLDSFRDARVTTFSAVEGLGKDAAAGILATRDGSIWIANDGSLDRIANGRVSSIRAGAGLPGHQVASLLQDRAGNLWAGVDDSLYVVKDGRFRPVTGRDGKPLGLVVALAEDNDGNIWASCAGGARKLVRIRDFQVREEFPASRIPPARTLAPDPRGGIWIGTIKGELLRWRDDIVERIALNPRGDAVSRSIAAADDGSVLAAGEDGLAGVRNGNVQRMTMDNGLPCNGILSFVKGNDQRLWIHADCGIVELADAELRRWWSDPKAVVRTRLLDRFDGFQPGGAAFFNGAARSADGKPWFANGRIVQMLDPSRLSPAPPATARIESVVADRREFGAATRLELPPQPRDLQINYTSPTFTAAQKIRFRYRLEPYDTDWHDVGNRRQAFYTDLPPGRYTFGVMAANADGAWSATAATLDFSIAPAYFQTSWFRLLCAAVLLALLWIAYRIRVAHLQRRFQMTLDARVGERMRIARDLHDTLLQSFHGTQLAFQSALELLPDRPAEAKRVLASAIDQAAVAITQGRDAVQGLRASTAEMNDLADALRSLGEQLATESGSAAMLRVETQGTARPLRPLVRDEVFRIAGEAVRNAFRHAHAKQIEVELRYDERQLRARVRDDGKGIDPALLRDEGVEGHFGLRGMRERAKLAGGKLTVWSAADAGTEVELTIPAMRAYQATSAARAWFAERPSREREPSDS